MKLSLKYIVVSFFLGFGLLIGVLTQFPDGRLRIYYCNVGQGDSIYIRTPHNSDILIDGGPGNKVLECLSRHMPFYDRTIDVVVMTHPQADHLNGLLSVIDRYKVNYFVASPVGHTTEGFQKLKSLITQKQIPIKNPYAGDVIRVGGIPFKVLWPDREWLVAASSKQQVVSMDTSNSNVLGAFTTSEDLNDFSIYLYLQMGEFDALFTGDGDIKMQDDLMQRVSLPDIEVLKVPHHGSRTGMSEEFLDALKPELAVISVGSTNRYGHPTQETLELLSSRGIKTLRTDEMGDIEVVSDGKTWWIKR